MKTTWSICGAALAALFLCLGESVAAPSSIVVDGYLPIPSAASYSSTFSVRTDGISWASAQVVVTSVTQPAQTFTDGTASSATFTVVSYTALSTATATGGTITISSNFWTNGNLAVSGGGPGLGSFNVSDPANFATGAVSSNTACNLAAAINAFNIVLATCNVSGSAAGVVYTTAAFTGSIWNSFTMNSSSQGTGAYTTVTQLSGGQDNQSVTVNGKTLTANVDFYPVTSVGQTATNLATAITNSSTTTGVIASAGGAVVYATSTLVGTGTKYAISSSSQAALTIPYTSSSTTTGQATGAMIGGTNAAYLINTSTIALPSNNFGLGQGVWLGGASLAPLVLNTTYYVVTIPPGSTGPTATIELALTSTGAIANVPIVLTASATKTTTDSFTLNVGPMAGTPTVTLVASNDNSHWLPYATTPFNISIPSVSYSAYVATGTVNNFDLGHYNYGYLGVSVVAPTSGAVNILAHIVGKE